MENSEIKREFEKYRKQDKLSGKDKIHIENLEWEHAYNEASEKHPVDKGNKEVLNQIAEIAGGNANGINAGKEKPFNAYDLLDAAEKLGIKIPEDQKIEFNLDDTYTSGITPEMVAKADTIIVLDKKDPEKWFITAGTGGTMKRHSLFTKIDQQDDQFMENLQQQQRARSEDDRNTHPEDDPYMKQFAKDIGTELHDKQGVKKYFLDNIGLAADSKAARAAGISLKEYQKQQEEVQKALSEIEQGNSDGPDPWSDEWFDDDEE